MQRIDYNAKFKNKILSDDLLEGILFIKNNLRCEPALSDILIEFITKKKQKKIHKLPS